MPVGRPLLVVSGFLLLSAAALCQSRLSVAPLPSDPLELATGPTKAVRRSGMVRTGSIFLRLPTAPKDTTRWAWLRR